MDECCKECVLRKYAQAKEDKFPCGWLLKKETIKDSEGKSYAPNNCPLPEGK